MVRELYRELARQSPLGKEEKSDRLLGILTAHFISCSTHLIPMFQMISCDVTLMKNVHTMTKDAFASLTDTLEEEGLDYWLSN